MSFRNPATSPASATAWSLRTWQAILTSLAIATILVHGFHPFAEDGGLYAAGVEHVLDPALFPHDSAFVTAHLRFSLFAPVTAILVRLTHLSLPAVLLLIALGAAFCTLSAAHAILRHCTADPHAQLAGLALLASGWTLPIAGTSLFLMDPYVTARTVSMPLSLWAIAFALSPWNAQPAALFLQSKPSRIANHPGVRCAASLLLAAAFHPLMAGYALLFVAALRATRSLRPVRAWILLAAALLLGCLLLQALAPAETCAERAAAITRYYWFLSQWQWYERLGLFGPVVMLALVLRSPHTPRHSPGRTLCTAAILLSLLTFLCALLFAHESSLHHAVARLQPLRAFLLVYAVMLLLLGATLYTVCAQAAAGRVGILRIVSRALPLFAIAGMAASLSYAAHNLYPASPHIELPWRMAHTPNPWVQAFLWARANTPQDALFALDARYVNTEGDDAQTFRAHSLRSTLPDYSKDGGEASITPTLAPAWLAGSEAQKDLSNLADAERDRRLQPYGVTWMVLHASAPTAHPCPYRNAVVKVCRLQ